ncbi:beta-lactamase family protein [Alphaproteobacteria bacterium KMM 3653]|uniref:Beta-lactamase family protein n=1 Tax=Harenicola maris TaxID=2841044 RepID=A0AAP2G3Z3_9RHOB|nr:beta-lactamase family protein [Harenicola maris]
MIRALAFLLLLLAAIPQGAAAQDQQRIAKIEKEWAGWVQRHRLGNSSIVILHNGRVVKTRAKGASVSTPVPLASLSKPITGACVAKLVQQGKVNLNSTAARYLGPNKGPGGAITIAELLTHSGGNSTDTTQKFAAKRSTWGQVAQKPLAARALARPLGAKRGRHVYNNENYAVLAEVIEAATGQPYFTVCNRLVLRPLGIGSAGKSRSYGGFSAWGGWQMSPKDYATFAAAWFGPQGVIGRSMGSWPHVGIGKGARYGMGVAYYANGAKGAWHLGMLCFGGRSGNGAYFGFYPGGYGVVVSFDKCIKLKGASDLEKTLQSAILR